MTKPKPYNVQIAGLNPLPAGSLLILASHRADWRDERLASLTSDLLLGGSTVIYIALGELPENASERFQRLYEKRCELGAENEAIEAYGHSAPYLPQGASEANRRDAKESWKRDRQKLIKDKYEGFKRLSVNFDCHYRSVADPTIDRITKVIEEERRDLPLTDQVIIIDDLCSIRRSPGKSGSPKLCGEQARALKDLAVHNKLLLVTAMPAPHNLKTVKLLNERREQEVELQAGEFHSYGDADESSDALVSTRYTWSNVGWELHDYAVVARYGEQAER